MSQRRSSMGRTGDRWFFGTDSVSNSGGRGPARDVWRAVLSLRADVCLLYAAFPSPDMTFSGSREAREVQGSSGSPGKLGKSREAREVQGSSGSRRQPGRTHTVVSPVHTRFLVHGPPLAPTTSYTKYTGSAPRDTNCGTYSPPEGSYCQRLQ
jgi:hypothetical protein